MQTMALRRRYGHAGGGVYETRGVLAGAYPQRSPKSFLTHTVEVTPDHAGGSPEAGVGGDLRVLCKRVKLEHMADSFASNAERQPTCPICLARDPRFKGA
jgi:hypothetical protein